MADVSGDDVMFVGVGGGGGSVCGSLLLARRTRLLVAACCLEKVTVLVLSSPKMVLIPIAFSSISLRLKGVASPSWPSSFRVLPTRQLQQQLRRFPVLATPPQDPPDVPRCLRRQLQTLSQVLLQHRYAVVQQLLLRHLLTQRRQRRRHLEAESTNHPSQERD